MMEKIGSLCTGYGGIDYAVQTVFGGELAWWSDVDPAAVSVMVHHCPDVPNIGDLKEADWASLEPIDILTAGYPCQPFSNAGLRKGIDDPRHLWPHIAKAVSVLRPSIVVLENVAGHVKRGFNTVTEELTSMGYNLSWGVVRASEVGAPHRRERLFIVATDANGVGLQRLKERHGQPENSRAPFGDDVDRRGMWGDYWPAIQLWEHVLGRRSPEPTVYSTRGNQVLSPYLVEWMMGLPEGFVTGVPGLSRTKQLKLLGNGVVPQQAEYAVRGLWEESLSITTPDS